RHTTHARSVLPHSVLVLLQNSVALPAYLSLHALAHFRMTSRLCAPSRGDAFIPSAGCVPNVRLAKSTRKDQRCAIAACRSWAAPPHGSCRFGSGTTQKSWLCLGIYVMIVQIFVTPMYLSPCWS